MYSRLDSWCTNMGPQAIGRFTMSVSVIGPLLTEHRPSDHLPGCARHSPLTKCMVRHDVFLDMRGMSDMLSCTRNLEQRHVAWVDSAHRATRAAQQSILQRSANGPRLLAEAALRLYVPLRDANHAPSVILSRPPLAFCGAARTIRVLRTTGCASKGASATRCRRSSAAKFQRGQHAVVHAGRRWVPMDARCSDASEALLTPAAAGAALSECCPLSSSGFASPWPRSFAGFFSWVRPGLRTSRP